MNGNTKTNHLNKSKNIKRKIKPSIEDAFGINFNFFTSRAVFETPTGKAIIIPTNAEKKNWKNRKYKLLKKDENIIKSFISRMKEITTTLERLDDLRSKEPYDVDHAIALVKSLLTDLRHFTLPKDELCFTNLLNIKSLEILSTKENIDFLNKLYAYWLYPECMETVSERCCGYNLYSNKYLNVLIYGWIAHKDKDKAEIIEKLRHIKGDEDWIKMAAILCHMMAAILAEYLIFIAALFPKVRKWKNKLPSFLTLNITANGKKNDMKMAALVDKTTVASMVVATDKEGKVHFKKIIKRNQLNLPNI